METTIELLSEELETLNNGGTINFYENEDLDLKIKIKGVKHKSFVETEIDTYLKLYEKEYGEDRSWDLLCDILNRYYNEEYFDIDIIENTDYEREEDDNENLQ